MGLRPSREVVKKESPMQKEYTYVQAVPIILDATCAIKHQIRFGIAERKQSVIPQR